MSNEWAPPPGQQPVLPNAEQPDWPNRQTGHRVDPYSDQFDTPADELAPVDRQADPAHWLPGKTMIIVAAIIGIALLATIVICLIVWITPPMHHLQVPSVPKG